MAAGAPKLNPPLEAAGAAASAGLAKENVVAGGFDAGVVLPAAALFPPRLPNSPPPLAGAAGLSALKPPNDTAGAVAPDDPVPDELLAPKPPKDGVVVEAPAGFAPKPENGAGEAAGVVDPKALDPPAPPKRLGPAGLAAGVVDPAAPPKLKVGAAAGAAAAAVLLLLPALALLLLLPKPPKLNPPEAGAAAINPHAMSISNGIKAAL